MLTTVQFYTEKRGHSPYLQGTWEATDKEMKKHTNERKQKKGEVRGRVLIEIFIQGEVYLQVPHGENLAKDTF